MTFGVEFHSQIKLSIKGQDIFSHAMSQMYVPRTHPQESNKGCAPPQKGVCECTEDKRKAKVRLENASDTCLEN